MSLDVLRQRVPATTCAKCRRQLGAGDRVVMAMIVQGVGRNPSTKGIEAMIGDEFELVHAECKDTSLDGKLIVT